MGLQRCEQHGTLSTVLSCLENLGSITKEEGGTVVGGGVGRWMEERVLPLDGDAEGEIDEEWELEWELEWK